MAISGGSWQQLAITLLNFTGKFQFAILFLCSWLLMFLIGPAMIRWLRQKRWRKDVVSDAEAWQVREDTPETHQKKQGTPSMGGIGLIGVAFVVFVALTVSSYLFVVVANPGTVAIYGGMWPLLLLVFLVPFTTVAHALLGFADDWSKASGRGGLRARAKLIGQVGLEASFLVAVVALAKASVGFGPPLNFSPWVTSPSLTPLWLFIFAALLWVLVLTCNATNLTDGIDGLAAGLAVQAGFAFFFASRSLINDFFASAFWAALAGSCLGFLAYNKHKAQVFMGDTGSLALGAALGAAAIMTHSVFLLPFIGFIYFVEAGSVTLQVLWFKYTKKKYGEGRRIFRRAPLHHHFELGGWSEWRVVGTFWGVNFVMACIGLILWHLKILPRFP